MRTLTKIALALACVAALPAAAARADSISTLVNGQGLRGVVPAGEVIRIAMPLAKGSQPRLNLVLTGSRTAVSFRRFEILGPDGEALDIADINDYFFQRPRPRRSVIRLRNWIAPQSGLFQVRIETNSLVPTDCRGRLVVRQRRRYRFVGDESENLTEIGLKRLDQYKVVTSRLSGDLPSVRSVVRPDSGPFTPFQLLTRRGTRTPWFNAAEDGVYGFEFGYRVGGSIGRYRARILVKPLRRRGLGYLLLANDPRIVVSVRDSMAQLNVAFGTSGCGVAHEPSGDVLLVTSEANGEILAKYFDLDFFGLRALPDPRTFVGPADMQPGESLQGHRLIFADGHFVVAWTTASGNNIGLMRRSSNMSRVGFREVVLNSPTPIVDPFLVSDGDQIALGIFDPSEFGHVVWRFGADLSELAPSRILIGGPGSGYAHSAGAGATWRDPVNPSGNGEFEFWAPDNTILNVPSDVHRQRYDEVWNVLDADATPIDSAFIDEGVSTAVSVDPLTGVVIVHYVEPLFDDGRGRIHRRIFEEDGTPVPIAYDAAQQPIYDDPVTELGTARLRPFSIIVGSSLYLAHDGTGGPRVNRFPIIR